MTDLHEPIESGRVGFRFPDPYARVSASFSAALEGFIRCSLSQIWQRAEDGHRIRLEAQLAGYATVQPGTYEGQVWDFSRSFGVDHMRWTLVRYVLDPNHPFVVGTDYFCQVDLAQSGRVSWWVNPEDAGPAPFDESPICIRNGLFAVDTDGRRSIFLSLS
jgi:hypothetical protein